mgnify:FL=1
MNTTPFGERASIVIFGCCNAGKSSLINAITSQNIAIVSDIRGTTTDPVKKTMELLPFGPVVITDTPGLDDKSTLGTLRVEKSLDYINQADLILFVVDASREATSDELIFLDKIKSVNKKYLIVGNKCDCENIKNELKVDIYVSALKAVNIDNLKNMMSQILSEGKKEKTVLGNMMKEKDIILLVTPIDASAPKGRLILPQQQVIREILDRHGIVIEVQVNEIKDALERIGNISLVICDSQVFKEADEAVPEDIPLTSFSIVFANYKGALQSLYSAAKVLDTLKKGDRILISEGCTHHRQCEDIGSVKIPRLVRKYTGLFDEDDLIFEFSTGGEFPKDVSMYKLIIHCGACMLNENQMKTRMKFAKEREIPMTNYGISIAYMNGILKRAMKPLENL